MVIPGWPCLASRTSSSGPAGREGAGVPGRPRRWCVIRWCSGGTSTWTSTSSVAAESADHQTYTELVAAVYGAYAKLKGKDRWGDKTPHYIRYMDELDRLFPTPSSCTSSATAVRWPLRWPRSGGGRSAVTGAFWWRRDVLRAGGPLGPCRRIATSRCVSRM